MATTMIPEPASLKSWEEAFQYPLPTVRKLTTRLRRDIDEHRSRLRSLVGTSYRDLLGTAERIIEMDKQIQSVETGLSDIGRRCSSGILERSDVNYVRLERAWSQQGGQEKKLRSTAQCKILAAALSAVSRLIRSGGNPLQAAKLMVLSRLLYKSLSDEAAPAMLERNHRMIASLRNKLLAYVDRKIGREDASTDELLGALSAYALLTSSTPKDVLKHLLAVRIAQLGTHASGSTTESILSALQLHTTTFVSVQTIFPKRLAEMLSTLAKATLLSDKHIKSVHELNLDIYGRWISDDIRAFTPWVQQENLSAQEGRQAMSEYSADARAILLRGVKECLARISSVETVLEVRKKVMSALLSIGTRIRMDGFQDQLEEIRDVFLERLEDLMQRAAVLNEFDPRHGRNVETRSSSIWDLASEDIDLSSGGMHFRKTILRQRNGHDAAFDRVFAPFETWRRRVESLWSNIQAVRGMKWDEHFEADIEEGDDEDTASYQEMLCIDDTARLEKQLHLCVREAIMNGFECLQQAVHGSTNQPQFYIRLLRELQSQHMELSRIIGLDDSASLDRHELATNLHSQLATTIASHGVSTLKAAYDRRHFVPIELWEGTPKLPLQPLPATFSFVLTIQQEMAKIGEDVWSAAAVSALKDAVQVKLQAVLELAITAKQTNAQTNGHDEGVEKETAADETEKEVNTDAVEAPAKMIDDLNEADTINEADITSDEDQVKAGEIADTADTAETATVDLTLDNIQRLFDGLYLSRVFSTGSSTLITALDTLKGRTELEAADIHRLERHAAEYWKRTYLLFGLLAETSRSYSRQ